MKKKNKELNNFQKIERFNKLFDVVRFVIALVIAFTVSLIIMSFFTDAPFTAIKNLFIGPLTSVRRFSTVIEKMIPLTFAGLAVCIMFKADQFNLASEGAIYMGALISAIVAISLKANPILVTIVSIISAGLVGMIVTAIPGYLKLKFKSSELVVSIMLNTVLLNFGTFIFNKTIRDVDSAYAASYEFPKGVGLGNIIPKTRLHYGLIIVIVFVLLTYWFLNKTKWGYKIKVTGSNQKFAKSVGIATGPIIMLAQLAGGFVAGVGGGVEMLGLYRRFQWMALPGFGFDGVVLNTIAKGNPLFIPLASFLVSYIRIGADYMYRQSDIASEIVAIIEGLLIILIAASSFLSKYRHKMTTKISKESKESKHENTGSKFNLDGLMMKEDVIENAVYSDGADTELRQDTIKEGGD